MTTEDEADCDAMAYACAVAIKNSCDPKMVSRLFALEAKFASACTAVADLAATRVLLAEAERERGVVEVDGLRYGEHMVRELRADRDRLRAVVGQTAAILDNFVDRYANLTRHHDLYETATAWTSLRPTVVAGEGGG